MVDAPSAPSQLQIDDLRHICAEAACVDALMVDGWHVLWHSICIGFMDDGCRAEAGLSRAGRKARGLTEAKRRTPEPQD